MYIFRGLCFGIDFKVLYNDAYTFFFFYQRWTKKLRSKSSEEKEYKKRSSYHILGAEFFFFKKFIAFHYQSKFGYITVHHYITWKLA